MDPAVRQPPRARPLEANAIDHMVRCYGGQTIAIEMEPRYMQKSKQPRDVVQYIDFLNRRSGELRLELTFYRECYRHAEKFKDKIGTISQDLLHACIVGLTSIPKCWDTRRAGTNEGYFDFQHFAFFAHLYNYCKSVLVIYLSCL